MMIRKIALLFAASLILAFPAAAGELPTAEEVFAKHTEAVGGAALGDVKNMMAEFTFDMPAMGLSTTGEAYMEAPDKSYTLISLMAMGSADFESGTHGEIAWQNNPQMGLRLLEGTEKRMALRGRKLDTFAEWEKLWETAETVAEEAVGETACYKVVLTPAEGEPLSAWFDKETGLLVKEEMTIPQMGATVVTTPSDYREVAGVMIPHKVSQDGPMAFEVAYTRVEINVDDIPADTFALPQRIEEMAAAE